MHMIITLPVECHTSHDYHFYKVQYLQPDSESFRRGTETSSVYQFDQFVFPFPLSFLFLSSPIPVYFLELISSLKCIYSHLQSLLHTYQIRLLFACKNDLMAENILFKVSNADLNSNIILKNSSNSLLWLYSTWHMDYQK